MDARLATFTFAGVVLLAGLAGCTSETKAPEDGAEDLSDDQVLTRYETAIDAVENLGNGTGPDAVAIHVETSRDVGGQTRGGTVSDTLVDVREGTYITAESQFHGANGAEDTSNATVLARFDRTTVVGEHPAFGSWYNASTEPVSGFEPTEDLLPEKAAILGSSELPHPREDLMDAVEVPSDATVTYERETREGQPVLVANFAYETDTDVGEVEAMLLLDPLRPLEVERHVETAPGRRGSSMGADVAVEFTWDDPSHDREEALRRIASMTHLEASEADGGLLSERSPNDGPRPRVVNYTIAPTEHAGLVPIDEVTARVTNGSQYEAETVITMPLEEGAARADPARLAFEDADASGTLTPGDRFVLERLDENASLTFQLEDEQTGLRTTTPASGVGWVLAVALAAAVGLSKRD